MLFLLRLVGGYILAVEAGKSESSEESIGLQRRIAMGLATFRRDGFARISNVLTEAEILEIEPKYNQVMSGVMADVMKKDFCDMSKPWGVPFDEWSIVNGMLPHRYEPGLADTVWTRRAKTIATAYSTRMAFDYDQLLDKRPSKSDAVFNLHQDMAYWPPRHFYPNNVTRTITVTLYLDDANEVNGCLHYVPGSHLEEQLRPHTPLTGSREDGHALVTELRPDDILRAAPVKRGDVTVHDEWVVHGSFGNNHPSKSRRTYVIAFRDSDIVSAERRVGFTHSHNDIVNWDTFLSASPHSDSPSLKAEL